MEITHMFIHTVIFKVLNFSFLVRILLQNCNPAQQQRGVELVQQFSLDSGYKPGKPNST
jgi:hypothetical protein